MSGSSSAPTPSTTYDGWPSEAKASPFPYELLREAWAPRDTSPRSALLIAVAALEVGVKRYIGNRVEAAKWLVDHLPAPDVIALISTYLPTLSPGTDFVASATTFERPSKSLRKLLRERRDQRNDLTHKPGVYEADAEAATADDARSAILAVRQVLLRLDAADGHAWARNYFAEPPYEEPPTGSRRVGFSDDPAPPGSP